MSRGKNFVKYEGIEFDSQEEVQFYIFLRDLKQYGYVKHFTYHPDPFLITPSVHKDIQTFSKSGKPVVKTKTIFRQHSYTADFKVQVDLEKFLPLVNQKINLLINGDTFFVDTKGSFNNYGGDRLFSIHQKLVYDKFKEFINKIVPSDFFVKIGYVPDELRWNKNRKVKTVRSKFIGLKPLSSLNVSGNNSLKNSTNQQINITYLNYE